MDRHLSTYDHSLHSAPSPAVLTLSCYWIQMVSEQESEVDEMHNSSSLKTNPPCKSLSSSLFILLDHVFNQVLWRRLSSRAAGVGSLAAVGSHLHTGGSGHMVAPHRLEEMWSSAAP